MFTNHVDNRPFQLHRFATYHKKTNTWGEGGWTVLIPGNSKEYPGFEAIGDVKGGNLEVAEMEAGVMVAKHQKKVAADNHWATLTDQQRRTIRQQFQEHWNDFDTVAHYALWVHMNKCPSCNGSGGVQTGDGEYSPCGDC
jgi:hypothetical protein